MKKLDVSSVVGSLGFYVKGPIWAHLQQAYIEVIAEAVQHLIGPAYDPTVVYILRGCVNSGSGSTFTMSAGSVFFNGEIYLVDAITFTIAGGQVPVATIVTSNSPSDPVGFTDGTPRNIMNIRKVVLSSAVSGSGISDFSAFQQTGVPVTDTIIANMPASLTLTFKKDQNIFFTAAASSVSVAFDATNARPGVVQRIKWTFGAGLTLTIVTGTGQTVIKDSGDLAAVASANNLLYVMYAGKNEIGNDEFSYVLKQV